MKIQEDKVYELRESKIENYFTTKEIFAMWKGVCRAGQENPYTQVLKGKLFRLMTEKERQMFYKKFD